MYQDEKNEAFEKLQIQEFKKFGNITAFIERNNETYQEKGRVQTFEEAKKVDRCVIEVMNKHDIEFHRVKMNVPFEKLFRMVNEEM